MKELKPEGGVTQISLENLAMLVPLHGAVRFMIHYDILGETLIVFQDGYKHMASGFSSGYRGEGPHGLLTAIQTYLKRDDITIHHICGWCGKNYFILPINGAGMPLESSDTTEIW